MKDSHNLIDVIQQKVDEINKKEWAHDSCPPSFFVSVLYEGDKAQEHKILLTVKHLSGCFSCVIFPQPTMIYGYESLYYEMQQLYNQTM